MLLLCVAMPWAKADWCFDVAFKPGINRFTGSLEVKMTTVNGGASSTQQGISNLTQSKPFISVEVGGLYRYATLLLGCMLEGSFMSLHDEEALFTVNNQCEHSFLTRVRWGGSFSFVLAGQWVGVMPYGKIGPVAQYVETKVEGTRPGHTPFDSSYNTLQWGVGVGAGVRYVEGKLFVGIEYMYEYYPQLLIPEVCDTNTSSSKKKYITQTLKEADAHRLSGVIGVRF